MKSQYVLPITIVVAGALIAGAVFLVGKSSVPTPGNTSTNVSARPFDASTDHILGNPNATVKVVEYMDLECPHCKAFETTMNQIINYYGLNGNVAWVSRPFPLASIHSKAPEEAEAAECAASLGGNTAYWQFIEKVFSITPSNNGLDLSQLPVIAGQIGLNVAAFNTCVSSGQFNQKVTDSYNEAIALGAQGTPFTLVMVGDQAITLSGDQPYDSMRAAIDAVLQNNPATASTTAQ